MKGNILFLVILLMLSFQNKSKETLIVDGWIRGSFSVPVNREATYYLWDNVSQKTIEINSRKELLDKLYLQGYTLCSTYTYDVGQNRFETWIFEK